MHLIVKLLLTLLSDRTVQGTLNRFRDGAMGLVAVTECSTRFTNQYCYWYCNNDPQQDIV